MECEDIAVLFGIEIVNSPAVFCAGFPSLGNPRKFPEIPEIMDFEC
jgi:hypothetical protein